MITEAKSDTTWFDKEITIERRVLGHTIPEPAWADSTTTLRGLTISLAKIGIEDLRVLSSFLRSKCIG
jgi:hypothetical protein